MFKTKLILAIINLFAARQYLIDEAAKAFDVAGGIENIDDVAILVADDIVPKIEDVTRNMSVNITTSIYQSYLVFFELYFNNTGEVYGIAAAAHGLEATNENVAQVALLASVDLAKKINENN